MKLGIMQPYVFPYIGYFQLINAVDKFVFLDDVNYINRGWINRNRILVNGSAHTFTVPLINASQNRLINEILIAGDEWKSKTIKTIELSYKKAPQFQCIFNLLKDVFYSSINDIATLAKKSIQCVCAYLEINTKLILGSNQYNNKYLKGEDRIIDMVIKENGTNYINPVGGTELYIKEDFSCRGLQLHFLKTGEITYSQFNNQFIPYLSIIDVMMFNDKQTIQQFLNEYELV